jgi:predicted ATPase
MQPWMPLKRLSLEETAALAASIFGRPPAPALADLLQERTQGVPFFVDELTHSLKERAQVQTGPVGLEWPAEVVLPIPDTVRDLVLGIWRRNSAPGGPDLSPPDPGHTG